MPASTGQQDKKPIPLSQQPQKKSLKLMDYDQYACPTCNQRNVMLSMAFGATGVGLGGEISSN